MTELNDFKVQVREALGECVGQDEATDEEKALLAVAVAEVAGELALESSGVRLQFGEGEALRHTDTGIELQRVTDGVLSTLNARVLTPR